MVIEKKNNWQSVIRRLGGVNPTSIFCCNKTERNRKESGAFVSSASLPSSDPAMDATTPAHTVTKQQQQRKKPTNI